VAALFGFIFLGATAKTYACSEIWNPNPTASPSPGTTPQLGYLQNDMGRQHDATNSQRYTFCPPASGSHFAGGIGPGPIQPRVYGPDDDAKPQSWIHNLEHGALVILYRCDGDACTDAGQARMQQYFQGFGTSPRCQLPPRQIGPLFARFDEMAWPYAAIVWDRVLPLQSFDTNLINQFWQQWGEVNNPEKFGACANPSASPSAGSSVAPSVGASGSVTPSGSVGPNSSAEASPSPS
jgi:hypothetical protein